MCCKSCAFFLSPTPPIYHVYHVYIIHVYIAGHNYI
nr:MAG TPA: hypothetical protein [Caudoviricetes sp.]